MTDDTASSLQTRISKVRHGGRELRVIRPAQPAPGIVLQDWQRFLHLEADQAGFDQLLAAWSLAAFSPHSIVFLPIRGNTDRSRIERSRADASVVSRLDLVFLHSTLQFRLAQWKEIRSRLGAGAAHTAKSAPPTPPADPDPARRTQRRSRNGVVFDSAAQTLFVVGTRDGFRLTADRASRLRTEPDACFDTTARHCCVLLRCGRRYSRTGRHATPGVLHLQLGSDT